MKAQTITAETDCEIALAEIERLMDGDPEIDSPEGERLLLLVQLVQEYEAKHFRLDWDNATRVRNPL